MRVIAGKAKGFSLSCVKSDKTRPTSDKVKGAIFSMIGTDVLDATVLDLFSGTASFAIEALSRGAKRAVVVEKDREAFLVCKKNLEHTRLSEMAQLNMVDALKFVQKTDEKFDFIFVDPPYNKGLLEGTMPSLSKLLNSNGVVIAEWEGDVCFPKEFEVMKEKQYGRTKIAFLEVKQFENCGDSR